MYVCVCVYICMFVCCLFVRREREAFLSLMDIPGASPKLLRQQSTPWTFIDEDVDGVSPSEQYNDLKYNHFFPLLPSLFPQDLKASSHLLLEESDYVAFFEQFPFDDLFRYILQFNSPGEQKIT